MCVYVCFLPNVLLSSKWRSLSSTSCPFQNTLPWLFSWMTDNKNKLFLQEQIGPSFMCSVVISFLFVCLFSLGAGHVDNIALALT